jgi:Tfp pilus assembly protein PilF
VGYAYLNKGDTKKAIEMFKKFLELDPDSPEAFEIKEVIKTLQ